MSLLKNLIGAVVDVATLPIAVAEDVIAAATGDRDSKSYTAQTLENVARSTVDAAEDLFDGRIL